MRRAWVALVDVDQCRRHITWDRARKLVAAPPQAPAAVLGTSNRHRTRATALFAD